MKKTFIYSLLFIVVMSFPASSKECGKLVQCTTAAIILKVKVQAAAKVEDMVALPASPFSRMVFNL